jgi:hypothetical protein
MKQRNLWIRTGHERFFFFFSLFIACTVQVPIRIKCNTSWN